ncbi:MAG: aminoacyl-tRNA hydrolase [bacterium]|nr:aminoacyl-tRNA hydrolase [bacterium]
MYLIVGLGNKGKEYENTHHNAGFLLLDKLQKEYNFPEFALVKKHSSLISEGMMNEKKVILVKPQTFMNASGKAVKSLLPKLSLGAPKLSLVVIHDDIDIPLGKVKVSENRGSAGHKGVESIIQALGTKNFTRIRIGVLPLKGKPSNVESFVLKSFLSGEKKLLVLSIDTAVQKLLALVK